MPRKRSKTSAQKIKIAQRRKAILDYRLQGVAVSTIAKAVGISTSQVIRDIQAELKDVCPQETRQQILQQELHRLDVLQHAFFVNANDGDLPAAKMVLDIMAQRARLLGLNADGKNAEVNLNFTEKPDAAPGDIIINFVPSKFRNEDTAEIVDFKPPPPPLKLVEHGPEPELVEGRDYFVRPPLPIPDPSPDAALPHPRAKAPRDPVPEPEHPGVINDRSKRLPDPVGPRTELELPKEYRPGSGLNWPPKGAA